MYPKKFTFGKILTSISILFFIFIICWCLYFPIDSTIAISIIAATGSLAVTTMVAYLKKSQAENLEKLNMATYKEMAEVRLNFNEGMLKLQQQYKVSDDDMMMLENQSDMDEVMESSKDKIIEDLNNFTQDSHILIERQEV